MDFFGRSYAADDLSEEWRQCSLKAMGLEGWEVTENEDHTQQEEASSPFQFINLLGEDTTEEEERQPTNDQNIDHWMQTALQIQSNIREMAAWIHQKKPEYIALEMPEEEASLIQSTVTSFAATTANEIESLHQIAGNQNSAQKQQHYTGIIQILMGELKENIAEPFGKLQKYRHRAAVELWQTPLQCRLTVRQIDPTNELLGIENEGETDQRFQPQRASHRLHRDFLKSYETEQPQQLPQRPTSNFSIEQESFQVSGSAVSPSFQQHQQKPPHKVQVTDYNMATIDEEEKQAEAAALQQEAALLQAKTHSDLDSVQKMEEMMVHITTLLSQFSNLVAEQQENVFEIADDTASAKKNIDHGKDNLVDAKERTAASRHYMATAIAAMGMLLLLFNWLAA